MPDITNAKLHITNTLAKMMEYATAPAEEIKRSQFGDEKPNPSQKFNPRKRSEKALALAAIMKNAPHIYVYTREPYKDTNERDGDGNTGFSGVRALIVYIFATSKNDKVKGIV